MRWSEARAFAWWQVIVVVAAGVLMVGACGSSGTGSGSPASTLGADARGVQAKLTTLANDAATQWSTQIGTLKSALSKLQTAVTGLSSGGSLSSVGSALASVKSAAQQLLTAAGAQCPSASASP
jgi:hypothetical protein